VFPFLGAPDSALRRKFPCFAFLSEYHLNNLFLNEFLKESPAEIGLQ